MSPPVPVIFNSLIGAFSPTEVPLTRTFAQRGGEKSDLPGVKLTLWQYVNQQ